MGTVTEVYPGWVPGPNPFGNQRAESTQTWYRKEVGRQFEIRMDFIHGGWVINKSLPLSRSHLRPIDSDWTVFRVSSEHRFSGPEAAMLWFELNKEYL